MGKNLALFLCLLSFGWISAQNDSIYIDAGISEDGRILTVNQKITYFNKQEVAVNKIKLLNWVAAYRNKNTALAYRKLEDRSTDLHFAKPEDLGILETLEAKFEGNLIRPDNDLTNQNLYFSLREPLKPGEKIRISLQYQLQLPSIQFTGYGTSEEQIALKYFFLVPDSFENEEPQDKQYHDIEETQNFGSFWKVNFTVPAKYFIKSNLAEDQRNSFSGLLKNDPEFLLSEENYPGIKTYLDGKQILVDFGYPLTSMEKQRLEFYLPLHLHFILEKTGDLPQKIFISEKFRKKEDFFGNDDIKFWKFRFQMFTDNEKTDMNYLSIITKNVVEQQFITHKMNDHWFKNGIKTYLEIEYLKKFYKDEKLLGDLPDNAEIFGIKPLKIFHASRLKLLDRYGLAYQYIMTQNLDQKIGEPFTALSNYNDMAISSFETGNLFNFISEKMEPEAFNSFLRQYLKENNDHRIDTKDFLDRLAVASHYSSDFLETHFQHKNRDNFNLRKFTKEEDNFLVNIRKNTGTPIPLKLETETSDGKKTTYWYDTKEKQKDFTFSIPQSDAYKITLNDNYIYPEPNFRDNYLYTTGIFANMKKIRFKFIKDIPNPEYNEIYLNPRVSFNNTYDKFVVGLNFKNKSLFSQKFLYSVTPSYSTGTGKFTGSAGATYSFLPPESFYRDLTLGLSGSYFHYDFDLAYRKFTASANMNFTKNPRSTVSRNLGASYSYFQKDLTPKMIAEKEYGEYNLWNVGYGYADSRLIHENAIGINTQWMEDFQKINAEGFYRWEFAPKKKMSFRLFAGYFLKNNTRNDIFDYGISKVSNYAFSYNLLGESATGGLLSQQFILADAGFKSLIPGTVNQWVGSVNYDTHVWKMFSVYADAGVFKNKGRQAEFIWDSGVKVRIIPDFLEVYFPVQSTLGFEPSFKDYAKRIRFTLVLNFSAIANTLRRGWY
ncbi:aminopeptidase [Chryseobacterium sp.]|uniref:aminopeptidase n=1 Tax=Chryseobacterium sp. TaxID=1871047 RepID=UPI001E535FA8|nr:aminopeptidase [Chryseobacterium sp.]